MAARDGRGTDVARGILPTLYRARPASPSLPSGSATPSLAQRSRRTFVPASDVAAQLEQIVRAGGKGSRMAHELR